MNHLSGRRSVRTDAPPAIQPAGGVRPGYRSQSIHAIPPVVAGETQSAEASPVEVQGKGTRSPRRRIGINPAHRGKHGFADDGKGTIRAVKVLVVRHGSPHRGAPLHIQAAIAELREIVANGVPARWTRLQDLPDGIRLEVVIDDIGVVDYKDGAEPRRTTVAEIVDEWEHGMRPGWLLRVEDPIGGPADRSRGTGAGQKPRRTIHPIAWVEPTTTKNDRAEMEARNYLAWCIRNRQF